MHVYWVIIILLNISFVMTSPRKRRRPENCRYIYDSSVDICRKKPEMYNLTSLNTTGPQLHINRLGLNSLWLRSSYQPCRNDVHYRKRGGNIATSVATSNFC